MRRKIPFSIFKRITLGRSVSSSFTTGRVGEGDPHMTLSEGFSGLKELISCTLVLAVIAPTAGARYTLEPMLAMALFLTCPNVSDL